MSDAKVEGQDEQITVMSTTTPTVAPAVTHFRASDSSDTTTESVLNRLKKEGPPYIFDSYTRVEVGDLIALMDVSGVDVLFRVTRMSNAKEFRERYPLDFLPRTKPVCYFEAEVVD